MGYISHAELGNWGKHQHVRIFAPAIQKYAPFCPFGIPGVFLLVTFFGDDFIQPNFQGLKFASTILYVHICKSLIISKVKL